MSFSPPKWVAESSEYRPDRYYRYDHLTELLQRRDQGIAFLMKGNWTLSSEWVGALEGEARWHADNLVEARQRAEAGRKAARLLELEAQVADAQQESRRWHAEYNREAALNAGLMRSWSWKLTSPIRAVAAWLRQ